MTAREVTERASEKLIQFSPTFSRMTTELYTPLLTRVWGILIRAGAFPPPPQEMVVQTPDGGMGIPPPQVSYSSKIALAIKGLENGSLMNVFEMWMQSAQLKPEVLDNLNWDSTFRDSVRNAGLPARWLVEMDDVEKIRQQRAQQQAAAQQKAEQMQAAEAAGKLGGIKEDSLVGRAVQNGSAGPFGR
jgi:hypothetical protein